MKETAVSVRRAGERIWRGKCASDPSLIAELIRKRAPAVKRVVFETGPLSLWFYHSLRTEGCRRSASMRAMQRRRSIWRQTRRTRTTPWSGAARRSRIFRAVRVKGFDSMLTRTLVAARTRFWLPLLDIIRLRAPLWRGFSLERRQNNPALPETERAPKGGFCPVLQRPTSWLGM